MATKVAMKKPFNYDDEDVDMDYKPTAQTRIVIERREIVGEVIASPTGSEPMVVAAFRQAGEYLNGLASQHDDPCTVQFEYEGVKFFAGYGDL